MVIHNYDFIPMMMMRHYHTNIKIVSQPTQTTVFHLWDEKTPLTSLLSCESVENADRIDVYVPEMEHSEFTLMKKIKKQLSMILAFTAERHLDSASIVICGNAKRQEVATALHHALADYGGVLSFIEICIDDNATLAVYGKTINKSYQS